MVLTKKQKKMNKFDVKQKPAVVASNTTKQQQQKTHTRPHIAPDR